MQRLAAEGGDEPIRVVNHRAFAVEAGFPLDGRTLPFQQRADRRRQPQPLFQRGVALQQLTGSEQRGRPDGFGGRCDGAAQRADGRGADARIRKDRRNAFFLRGADGGVGQRADTAFPQRRNGNARHVQRRRKGGGIDASAARAQLVGHIEGDDGGQSEAEELQRQIQPALGRGAVDDVDNRVWPLVGQEVACDKLLRRIGGQRINARQVGQLHVGALLQGAARPFDGHAGKVPHAGAAAGQQVEQRCLSAVGVPDERQPQHVRPTSTSMYCASAVRSESS